MHLKRLGDYIQFDIFNNSNLTYFQTVDEFCFLYALIMANPYKVIILNKKTIALKINYNRNEYCLSINHNKIYLIDNILEKIIEIINKYNLRQNQHGGKPFISSYNKLTRRIKKIDNNKTKIKINNTISNYIMNNTIIDNLIDVISKIPYNPLSYLTYKINRDNYKILLGSYFDEINEIIEHLKIFATIRYMESQDIIKCFESLLFFEKLMVKYECKTTIDNKIFDFIHFVSNKFNDTNFKIHFNTSPQVYFDVVINYDKYNIDYSMNSDDMHKTLINRFYYDVNEEERKYDIFFELEKNLEYVECRDKLIHDEINLHFHPNDKNKLSSDEITRLQTRINELEDEMEYIMDKRMRDDYEKTKNKIGGKRETNIDVITNCCSKIIYKLVKKK